LATTDMDRKVGPVVPISGWGWELGSI